MIGDESLSTESRRIINRELICLGELGETDRLPSRDLASIESLIGRKWKSDQVDGPIMIAR